MKRVFLIVLDSFGIGEMPDADQFGDQGSNTLAACRREPILSLENLKKMGLFKIDGVEETENDCIPFVNGSYARMAEASRGKDTTIGHWEIAGLMTEQPLPTFPNGFPVELIEQLKKETGRGALCNLPYSGTEAIQKYGREHEKTGDLIVYTSADSVLQIAAHEQVVPIEELYHICEQARQICKGPYSVGRVIARPFQGEYPNYERTSRRHDYSLTPPKRTMLDYLQKADKQVIGIGKIADIFAGQGISRSERTKNNLEGIQKTLQCMKEPFEGLCFTNLVDFDMLYGHRNDVYGYAKALNEFDQYLPELQTQLKEEDLLMITADHGCDPSTKSTDHSREYTPFLVFGRAVRGGCNLGTRKTFADIAATILDYFKVPQENLSGTSMLPLFYQEGIK